MAFLKLFLNDKMPLFPTWLEPKKQVKELSVEYLEANNIRDIRSNSSHKIPVLSKMGLLLGHFGKISTLTKI